MWVTHRRQTSEGGLHAAPDTAQERVKLLLRPAILRLQALRKEADRLIGQGPAVSAVAAEADKLCYACRREQLDRDYTVMVTLEELRNEQAGTKRTIGDSNWQSKTKPWQAVVRECPVRSQVPCE